ncbi:ferredoxin-fold anticodon-binding domain-containing protein 1 isoform X3 [Hydra vulgaris]|uniref:Ferredoxin-fold anticodon-binding domain-containing protein 1 isoform X3 n=1 Tax=Hydra vulgaris TaxID=6087 RepID=A0ABM4D4X7_HYDVU
MLDLFTNIQSAKDPHDGILIVGDGNFSFSMDMACFTSSIKIHATSLDSKETIFADECASTNVKFLYSQPNVVVKHNVDATNLSQYFPNHKFALIIFNFPHVGGKSNIKKCRLLLEKFFASSVTQLCDQGKVLVSLCKGQGGTPRDISRGAYGNSWKVSTQAAKAGLVLLNVEPFDTSSLTNYRQAGYRSSIKNGFLTNSALLHTFVRRSFVNLTEIQLKDESWNIFIEKMKELCSKSIEKQLSLYNIEVLFSSDLNKLNCKCIKQIIRRLNTKISPISASISFDLKYTIHLTKCELSSKTLKEALLVHFREKLFSKFFVDSKENSCFLHASCVCKSYHYNKTNTSCNVDFVPDFVDEIPVSFWTSLPEITVSFNNDTEDLEESISYKKITAPDYEMTEVEKVFLKKDHTCFDNVVTCFYINGFCVANLIDNGETLDLQLRILEIFLACYEIKSLKYLWSDDDFFKQQLLLHMNTDSELQILTTPSLLRGSILYPLCYRHDLCLWLDNQHSEEELLSTILTNAHDCLYGIVLLKLLNYKESNLVSYCYRMIYSRLDGPLTHLDSVIIQNNVRLRLLEAGFKLR